MPIGRFRTFVSNRGKLLDAIEEERLGRRERGHWTARRCQIADAPGETPDKDRKIIASLVRRVEVRSDRVKLRLSRNRLTELLNSDSRERTQGKRQPIALSDRLLTLKAPAQLMRVGREIKLLAEDSRDNRPPDTGFLRILARAHDIQTRLDQDARISPCTPSLATST